MKLSKFNSIISLNAKLNLVYNAYSDHFLIITNKIDYLDDFELIKRNQTLYNKLKQAHCIIENDIDEIALVKDIQKKVDENPSSFHLTINPTLACNFKCWYCYESHVPHSKMNDRTLEGVKKLIANIIKNQIGLTNFSLNFFGGEPLLCFDRVKKIISFAEQFCKNHSKSLSIGFTSNGYLLNENKIEWMSKYSVNFFQITLDGNREKHNHVRFSNKKNGSYDQIIKNIKLLLQKHIGVILRINYTSDNVYNIADILEDLANVNQNSKAKLDIQFHRVWQDNNGADIDIELNTIIDKFINKGFVAHKFPLNNVRSSCYADKLNGAIINYNGDVFRCTALNFTEHQRDGYLTENGDIMWENNSKEIRRNAKFNNKPCLHCRILPICNGGCSQKAIEYQGQDYCILGFDESEKDKAILSKLKEYILYNPVFSFTDKEQ